VTFVVQASEAWPLSCGSPGSRSLSLPPVARVRRRAPIPIHDEQSCVERALRRNPDPAAVDAARVAFGEECDAGHADACSALGVMNELGVGRPADPSRAVALYARACDFGNVHG
jgi:TPR repeat protein